MHLVFTETPSWPVRGVTPNVVLPPPTELEIYVTPLLVMGNSWDPWRKSSMEWGTSADARIDVIGEKRALSAVEWPVRIIESVVVNGDQVTEARITVLYLLMEWNCTVILRGTPAQVAADRERAVTFMLSGRPDWSGGDVASLAELYAESRPGS